MTSCVRTATRSLTIQTVATFAGGKAATHPTIQTTSEKMKSPRLRGERVVLEHHPFPADLEAMVLRPTTTKVCWIS